MIKTNLPVVLLKGLVLLPYEDARVELNNKITKHTIELSKLYHNNELLIVCPINSLEESPDTSDLPKVGVVGKIKSNIELPNGNNRISIEGLYRVNVEEYVNYSDEIEVLESLVTTLDTSSINEIEESAYFRKLNITLNKYIKANKSVSNSILSQIKETSSLDKLTDLVSAFLPLSFEKKITLMQDISPASRAKFLIEEISIENAVLKLEEKIEINLSEELELSQKEFYLKEKIKVIKNELGEVNDKDLDIENLKEKASKVKLPSAILEKINYELERYKMTTDASPEVSSIRQYIETLLNIPWNKYTKDETDLMKIESTLNESHYGLEEIKERIIEHIALKSVSKNVNSPILCLLGPPGVGKTTFVETISKALKREFVKISLGGMSDSSELVGHRRTYVGSSPGRIINSLIKCKSSNPVLLLDEVDKLKYDYKGDPASTLLDILDKSQNNKFIDNYVEEEVDLSKVLFILTANNINKIPDTLLDRFEIIKLSGYTDPEKKYIAYNYIISKYLEELGLDKNIIKFEEKAIEKIIENYTAETGVRELERVISKIIGKIITEAKKENKDLKEKTINVKDLHKYLKAEKYRKNKLSKNPKPGLIKAIGSGDYGGVCIDIEATSYPGGGLIKSTGNLGKILEESIMVSISYIKSNASYFKIDSEYFNSLDIHVHFREASVPKDGPSAGVAVTTALLSLIKGINIPSTISMSGEMSLNGDVLGIGNLKAKAIEAIKNGITTFYISEYNLKDLDWLDNELKEKINFIPIKDYKEIYKSIFS